MGHFDSKDQTQNYKEPTEDEFERSIPFLRDLLNFSNDAEEKYKELPKLYVDL